MLSAPVNLNGSHTTGSGSLDAWRREFSSAFDSPDVEAPMDLAQHLVHGSVTFARGLGFEPHEEFPAAAAYLREPAGPAPIEFGRDGAPFYVVGLYDRCPVRHPHARSSGRRGQLPLCAGHGAAGRSFSAALCVAVRR